MASRQKRETADDWKQRMVRQWLVEHGRRGLVKMTPEIAELFGPAYQGWDEQKAQDEAEDEEGRTGEEEDA
jgi:hypothetical protein